LREAILILKHQALIASKQSGLQIAGMPKQTLRILLHRFCALIFINPAGDSRNAVYKERDFFYYRANTIPTYKLKKPRTMQGF
jgi:hypothetical protein